MGTRAATRRHRDALALVVAGLLSGGGCSSSSSTAGEDSTASPPSSSSVVATSAPATTAASSIGVAAEVGTLVVILEPSAVTPPSADDLATAVALLSRRADALGSDTTVEVVDDTIEVTVRGVTEAVGGAIAASVGITGRVYLRPVIGCAQASAATAPADSLSTATDSTSDPNVEQVLPTRDGEVCQVGPSAGTAAVFAGDAAAQLLGDSWGVTVGLRPGSTGEGVWNALAGDCYAAAVTCPSRRVALEVDGQIVSAPTVNAPTFAGSLQISGQFTEIEAQVIADVLNEGALPFALTVRSSSFTID